VYEGVLSEGKVVSPEGVATALERLYEKREHRLEVASACYGRATQSKYTWEVIGTQWDGVFREAARG
jgi:glycosyltransferase involved in cell wall biosynthesis